MIKKVIEFLKLSWQVKYMMVEAMVYSARYRYQITHIPFREMAPDIGTFQYETKKVYIDDQALEDTSWAVNAACKRVQWDSKCLDRALTAKKILNKRGYPCTMYMGVKMDEKQEMSAHAWLRCGNRWITGGDGSEYAITGIYGDHTEMRKKDFSFLEDIDKKKTASMVIDDPYCKGRIEKESLFCKEAVGKISLSSSFLDENQLDTRLKVTKLLKDVGINSLVIARPSQMEKIHILLSHKKMEEAIKTLSEAGYVNTSCEDKKIAACFVKKDEIDVCLYRALPSVYGDNFWGIWNRATRIDPDGEAVYGLALIDEVCYLTSLCQDKREVTPALQAYVKNLYVEQKESLDALYNRAKYGKSQKSILSYVIDLYRREGKDLLPYEGEFLSVLTKEDGIVVHYDPLMEKDIEEVE